MTFRRAALVVLAVGAIVLLPSLAQADITAFVGSVRTTVPQTVFGAAVSGSFTIVAFELEYTNANGTADVAKGTPGLSFSAFVRTPTGRVQFYGGLGVGVYRETLGEASANWNTTMNVGGGLTVGLSGPLRVRVDYRIITIKNPATSQSTSRQRVYAGVNLKF